MRAVLSEAGLFCYVWTTQELMRRQGWRVALLHRAATGVFKATDHFGMPGWPTIVDAAIKPHLGADTGWRGAVESATDHPCVAEGPGRAVPRQSRPFSC
ncbi:hypothetical protein SBRY_20763 [Actinacidiphila bryophytorum]|uniref:Uncharacterized protein n=1 Tax=Actinacidiphila bryophytorum TaxID=1436133 RepID=A0A9W4GYG8_9ACTN|nr:hypothetical protein SBRY_20763 [Actinacidiphila bryophytorum]